MISHSAGIWTTPWHEVFGLTLSQQISFKVSLVWTHQIQFIFMHTSWQQSGQGLVLYCSSTWQVSTVFGLTSITQPMNQMENPRLDLLELVWNFCNCSSRSLRIFFTELLYFTLKLKIALSDRSSSTRFQSSFCWTLNERKSLLQLLWA